MYLSKSTHVTFLCIRRIFSIKINNHTHISNHIFCRVLATLSRPPLINFRPGNNGKPSWKAAEWEKTHGRSTLLVSKLGKHQLLVSFLYRSDTPLMSEEE